MSVPGFSCSSETHLEFNYLSWCTVAGSIIRLFQFVIFFCQGSTCIFLVGNNCTWSYSLAACFPWVVFPLMEGNCCSSLCCKIDTLSSIRKANPLQNTTTITKKLPNSWSRLNGPPIRLFSSVRMLWTLRGTRIIREYQWWQKAASQLGKQFEFSTQLAV